ncbi:MAG: hypothetical protein AAF637_16400 [Pseudomonadota bacterium]
MRFRPTILSLATLLIATVSQTAHAADQSRGLSPQSIAQAVQLSLSFNRDCEPTNPYVLYRTTCVGTDVNNSLERSPFERLSDLDHLAIFVHKHRHLNTTQQILPGIKFKIGVNLSNVYQQEAKVESKLRIRW